jgi:ABC-type lipoprotein export system ATPase subunit
MPKKVQIKLLSQSGELLLVTNCVAGQVSVLRSESPRELKPYQQALSGFKGKEKFVINVDGAEYFPEQHNLIGFGEVPPHAGQTVSQYLVAQGVMEGSVNGLLMAYGLETTEHKQCSSLSHDEERRVRILAATITADKVLVLNEPFEPVSSQWRERFAEHLADYARTKNGVVIVASLSYRPDAWIDNPIIARQQVGQSLRKTIGFGSAGSESTILINQLRDQIRQEQSHDDSQGSAPVAAAASLGTSAAFRSKEMVEDEDIHPSGQEGLPDLMGPWWKASGVKLLAGLSAAGLGVWAAITVNSSSDSLKKPAAPPAAIGAVALNGKAPDKATEKAHDKKAEQNNKLNAPSSLNQTAPEKKTVALILDRYPEAIRVSLLDTSRGIMGEVSVNNEPPPNPAAPQPGANNGNLYSLLESASSNKPDPASNGGWEEPELEAPQGGASEEPAQDYNASEEESRREAIRQKFLEAIRAAAERRQQEGGEE